MCRSSLRSLALLSVALAWPAIVRTQERSRPASIPTQVHGQVRFSVGGAPAENVLVRLETFGGGLADQSRTDRSGKFQFSGLQKAQYTITVSAPGFVEGRQQVDLQTTTSAYVLIQLVPEKSEVASDPSGAVELLDAKVPLEARIEFEKGRTALLNKRKIEEGTRHLEKATGLYPNFREAQLLLGTAYMDASQWDKAEGALRRSLEIDPQTPAALFALGEVYLKRQRYKEAEKSLQDGLKLDSRSWQAHFTLARVYWTMGDLAKAGPEVGRAIQLKPDFAESHLLAGNIFLRARHPENALPMFEEYLRLEPKGKFSEQTRELIQKIKRALAEKNK